MNLATTNGHLCAHTNGQANGKLLEKYEANDYVSDFVRKDSEDHFQLDESFIAKYRNKQPKFGYGGLGQFVFYRTYSRIKEDGNKESFLDVIRRVVEGTYEIQRRYCRKIHVPWTERKAQLSAQEMFERMWQFKFLPPGRGLWCMGTKFMWERGSAAINNCGFCSTQDIEIDPAEPFCFLMDMSMLGVGIGFDTRGAGKIKFVKPHDGVTTVFEIPDSREGWVTSERMIIDSFTTRPELGLIEFKYDKIRPAGTPIKGFGGVANGPEVLVKLHAATVEMLSRYAASGEPLDSVGITDLMNMIGAAIVAGNVRRCLPRGTLVHLQRGLVPIELVQVGDLVLTAHGYHKVAECINQGVQRVLTIKTKMGQFRCTAKHRMAVMDRIGSYHWRRAHTLKAGDRLVFVGDAIDGTNTVLPSYSDSSTRGNKLIVPGLTTDVAWFLGTIHGDGYVYPGRPYCGRKHHGASVMIPINRDEYHDSITDKINIGFAAFGFADPGEQPSADNCRKVRVISKRLAHYFYKHFKQARTPLGVPEYIRLGTKEIRAAYLAGLLDTDGSTKNRPTSLVDSVYYDFLRQVQAVYSSLGIPTKLHLRKEADGNDRAKWRISLVGDFAITKFNELVQPYAVKQLRETGHASGHDFGFPTEWIDRSEVNYGRSWSPQQEQMTYQRALLCGAKTGKLVPVEVYEVVDEAIEVETHDLSVPDCNEFVAQGLLVHNSAEIAFANSDDVGYMTMKDPNYGFDQADMELFWPVATKIQQEIKQHRLDYPVPVTYFRETGIPLERLVKIVAKWNYINQWRWASNNSVFASVGDDYSVCGRQSGINGEPGYAWLENLRNFGRLIDGPKPGCDDGVMGTNPCSEQALEPYELCCLCETFPANHDNAEDYWRTLKFAYLYAKTVTLLPTHNERTNSVMLRNRRIGLSQSGIIQAFHKFGRRHMLERFCNLGYHEICKWDKIYSRWLCVPESIKKTSVKPSGTVSLVTGAWPGIHHQEHLSYWRRVRLAKISPLVKILADAGYDIEPAVTDKDHTVIVKFGVVEDAGLRPVTEVSIWEQVVNVVDYQRYWADNQPSCTIKVKPSEIDDIPRVLAAFDDQLKCISFLPLASHGYVQAPYEPAPREEVAAYLARLKPIDFDCSIAEEAVGTKFCDGDSCQVLS